MHAHWTLYNVNIFVVIFDRIRFHWTLKKEQQQNEQTPCTHIREGYQEETNLIFFFVEFLLLLLKLSLNSIDDEGKKYVIMEPHIIFNTHLPPRSPLPASYLNSTLKTKRERVLKRNQVSFIDCCIGCRNKKKTKKILLGDFFLLVPFLLFIFLFEH